MGKWHFVQPPAVWESSGKSFCRIRLPLLRDSILCRRVIAKASKAAPSICVLPLYLLPTAPVSFMGLTDCLISQHDSTHHYNGHNTSTLRTCGDNRNNKGMRRASWYDGQGGGRNRQVWLSYSKGELLSCVRHLIMITLTCL